MKVLVLLFCALQTLCLADSKNYENYQVSNDFSSNKFNFVFNSWIQVLRVSIKNEAEAEMLSILQKENLYDFWTELRVGKHVDLMSSPEQLDDLQHWLSSNNLHWSVMISDVQVLIIIIFFMIHSRWSGFDGAGEDSSSQLRQESWAQHGLEQLPPPGRDLRLVWLARHELRLLRGGEHRRIIRGSTNDCHEGLNQQLNFSILHNICKGLQRRLWKQASNVDWQWYSC